MWWRSQISLWKHMPAHLSQTGCGALYLQHISNTSALSLPEIFKSPSLSPSQLIFTVSFLPQMLLPSLFQNIVALYQENQKHFSLSKTIPSPPAAFPFPCILLVFMKGCGGWTLSGGDIKMYAWADRFHTFNLSQPQKLIGWQRYQPKLLTGWFLLPSSSSSVNLSKIPVCHSLVTWLFHYSHQFQFLSHFVLRSVYRLDMNIKGQGLVL